MQLTVLGSSASQPGPGDACSGYLVTAAETHVLLDCGSGVLPRLQQHVSIDDLDAIVISHLHADHYLDLVPLRYGRAYGGQGTRPIDVHLPPGGIAHLERLAGVLSASPSFWGDAVRLREYEPGAPLVVAGLSVRPHELAHGIPSFGALVVHEGRRLAYSADTAMCNALLDLALGAHVLLAEATLGPGAPAPENPLPHLSPADAGRVAAEAGVERLILTHFWPATDRDAARREAQAVFGGPVLVARPGLRVEI